MEWVIVELTLLTSLTKCLNRPIALEQGPPLGRPHFEKEACDNAPKIQDRPYSERDQF